MLKASPNFHKGINFIQISSLPFEQQLDFQTWIPDNCLMQLQINNITLEGCVDYQDYTYWFDFQFEQNNTLLDVSL
ncbi:hypothetical protein JKA74_15410 [Marivirga sp. S37H4]|uniref:Uncharacterized protein n=1 Tax=Marivirga aurantiaca TaxID=2802615 RepID=A0A934X0V1_9BACT|nr:hypothetical protein [Marivirga aurantiaca]MBK6266432.1 hypothetical protein [Marivirga aurantiaca]